jgi:hypothetical protein
MQRIPAACAIRQFLIVRAIRRARRARVIIQGQLDVIEFFDRFDNRLINMNTFQMLLDLTTILLLFSVLLL